MNYLNEIAAICLVEIASVDIGGSRVPDWAVLAVVKVSGFHDLVRVFPLAKRRSAQRGDGDVGVTIASHCILLIKYDVI